MRGQSVGEDGVTEYNALLGTKSKSARVALTFNLNHDRVASEQRLIVPVAASPAIQADLTPLKPPA